MLTVEHLHVFRGESQILHDVSIAVPSGAVVCLMGRNGVGKTTLLKAIMGLLKPRQGSIRLDDQDLTRRSTHQRARTGIGYVPQGRGIFPYLSVYENLLIGLEALPGETHNREAIEEMYTLFPVLKEMGIRVAGTLSGGQQQQLAFARALVGRPKLLLLDEPTEGIQPSIMHQIEEVILMLRQRNNVSILLVEQFLDFALNVGDYFCVMETGRIVAQGSIDEFDLAVAQDYLSV